ncbi:hypothetical protein FQA47_016179 [Oryzias melastigma]|uniref:Uncharacterized protein n=1 Tax=Oryzias melastigma TaxID=30732 RepID=A0A834FU67_ORYME|nr:hypothetical protein FQA47_016179 [Oryzias melastigma]
MSWSSVSGRRQVEVGVATSPRFPSCEKAAFLALSSRGWTGNISLWVIDVKV